MQWNIFLMFQLLQAMLDNQGDFFFFKQIYEDNFFLLEH